MRLLWGHSYLMLFGVGVSCSVLYSIDSYLYICKLKGKIASIREEKAHLNAIVYP